MLALVFSISMISARQEAPLPSFEVASIKQDHSQDNSDTKTRLFQFPSPGRFHTVNMPVKLMIQFAYNINPSQNLGGPFWVGSQGYVIDAKVDDSLVPDLQKLSDLERRNQMRLMVRSLLADRFKLILSLRDKGDANLCTGCSQRRAEA